MNTETETDASRIMFINSADTQLNGLQFGLTTDYTFIPDESIVVPPHHAILLSLHHTQIPYSFYNFQNNRNNKLDFSLTNAGVSGSTAFAIQLTITLPEANYNAATLLTTIKRLLEAHPNWGGGIINIRFNRDTLKYEWNYRRFGLADSRLTLRIGTGNNKLFNFRNEVGFSNTRFINGEDNLDVWFEDNGVTQLGGKSDNLLVNTTLFTGTTLDSYWNGNEDATTYNRFSCIDVLASIRSLYIRTNLTTGSVLDSSVGGGFSNILARVPIEVGSGGIITVSPSDGSIHKLLLKIKEISQINVRLTDQKNRVIDLNGLNWDISLQFDFIEPPEVKVPIDKRLKIEKKKYDNWKTKTDNKDKKNKKAL